MQPLLKNKKAHFDYEILDTYTAGVELLGLEVKSIRGKHGRLEGSHVIVRGGEAFLVGADVPPYQPNNTPKSYETDRNRRLLLTKKEIEKLAEIDAQKGLTIVPLVMYNAGKGIKLEIGVGRGKKKYDKRQVIQKRDLEREMGREYKGRR